MNDLAQQALRAVDGARSRVAGQVRAHPHAALAVAGFVAGSVTVVAGGRIGTVRTTIPLTNWLGLLSVNGVRPGFLLPGSLQLLGIMALVGLWALAVRINRPERCGERTVWWMAGAWALPFTVGPPLLSSDVYTYAAQGLMVRHGFDPYHVGPSVLGDVRAAAAVDPSWRSVPSPYGPLATTMQHLAIAISGGNPLGAVIVLRAVAVVSVVAIGVLAADLAGPRRVQALTMTVLNPLLLLQVISAAHLEGLMCALLLGSLVAANRGHWVLGIVLGCASAAVKAPALLVVAAIIAVRGLDRRGRPIWRAAGRDLAVAGAAFGALSLLVPDGFGWIKALNTPTLGQTPFAPASLVAGLFTPVVQGASFDDRAAGGRITAAVAAVCIVGYLLATAHRRSLNRTAGFALLAVGVLSPVVYPWYLLWGLLCLVPTARAARTDWLVLACGLACLATPNGFNSTITNTLTVVFLAVAALVIAPRIVRRHRRTPWEPPLAATPAGQGVSAAG